MFCQWDAKPTHAVRYPGSSEVCTTLGGRNSSHRVSGNSPEPLRCFNSFIWQQVTRTYINGSPTLFEHLPCLIKNKQNIFICSFISEYACGIHVYVFICVCTSCVTLTDEARLADQRIPGTYISAPHSVLGFQVHTTKSGFHVGAEDQNPGPHACAR